MERALILEGVRRVLSEHLGIRDVTEATHILSDLKLDSIQQLTFVVELENHFRVRFDEGDETGINTIGDVVEAVARRLEGPGAPKPRAKAGP
jgi:acyl carrier protein